MVREFRVVEDGPQLDAGKGFSYFQDPDTGKFYRPTEEFVIEGDDLSDKFVEIAAR